MWLESSDSQHMQVAHTDGTHMRYMQAARILVTVRVVVCRHRVARDHHITSAFDMPRTKNINLYAHTPIRL